MSNNKIVSPKDREELFKVLKERFDKNSNRHLGIEWKKVAAKIAMRALY